MTPFYHKENICQQEKRFTVLKKMSPVNCFVPGICFYEAGEVVLDCFKGIYARVLPVNSQPAE